MCPQGLLFKGGCSDGRPQLDSTNHNARLCEVRWPQSHESPHNVVDASHRHVANVTYDSCPCRQLYMTSFIACCAVLCKSSETV